VWITYDLALAERTASRATVIRPERPILAIRRVVCGTRACSGVLGLGCRGRSP